MTLRELGFSRDRMYLFKGLSGRVRANLSLVCRGIFAFSAVLKVAAVWVETTIPTGISDGPA